MDLYCSLKEWKLDIRRVLFWNTGHPHLSQVFRAKWTVTKALVHDENTFPFRTRDYNLSQFSTPAVYRFSASVQLIIFQMPST